MTAALFDLAVNRAASLCTRFPRSQWPQALQQWHARTRFAKNISLDSIREKLQTLPHSGQWHWQGGPSGSWQPGKANFP